MRIKSELNKLKTMDIYSLILFALFKLQGTAEYSALSELAYVLDRDNFLKLCEYFGGLTIKIPTIDEVEDLVHALMLYQYTDIDNMPFDVAMKTLSQKVEIDTIKIKSIYLKLKDLLRDYEFSARQKEELQ